MEQLKGPRQHPGLGRYTGRKASYILVVFQEYMEVTILAQDGMRRDSLQKDFMYGHGFLKNCQIFPAKTTGRPYRNTTRVQFSAAKLQYFHFTLLRFVLHWQDRSLKITIAGSRAHIWRSGLCVPLSEPNPRRLSLRSVNPAQHCHGGASSARLLTAANNHSCRPTKPAQGKKMLN